MLRKINPGTLINNRYLIKNFLGQGGFGRTYLASDMQRFGEACVLKEFIATNANAEIIQKNRILFEREARILYKIEHPQIPQFKACFNEKKRLFIVQEFIDGETYSKILKERLSRTKKPFSESEVRNWLLEILPILDYIHKQHIIHRDISLDNIMFSKQLSKPVLIDFGIVKEQITQIFKDSYNQQVNNVSMVGKFGYSPPEQLYMGYCYPCSDLYALGVCAVVLLTGKKPFMLIDQSLEWQWDSYVKLSESLTIILRKMLAEKPNQRYQSAQEILKELKSTKVNIKKIITKTEITTTKIKKRNSIIFNNQPHITIRRNSRKGKLLQLAKQKLRLKDKKLDSSNAQKATSIRQDLLEYYQQELMSFIGPFGNILVKQILEYHPKIKSEEMIDLLAEAIPIPEQAKEFKNRLGTYSQRHDFISINFGVNDEKFFKKPTIFSTKFLEDCRRELTSFIGPFATIVIDDILSHNYEMTPKEFIENLIIEIPDIERAEKFKKRIEALY